MNYIDIHSHLHDAAFDTDRGAVLARMRAGEVATITVGTDIESSRAAIALAEREDGVWATVGIHPTDTDASDIDRETFRLLARHEKVVGIGECGIDLFRSSGGQEELTRQRHLFEEQIICAREVDKPLMLHVRDAYAEVLDILEVGSSESGGGLRGNVHFFAGDMGIARRFLDLGFTLSFTGVVTFTSDYDEVVRFVPGDMILAETDAPYVAPVPYRGKRNEPSFVVHTVNRLAEIRGVEASVFADTVLENARKVFFPR
ncbi:MAG: TatD family hydrolase [Candidatus Yonathbacteria bacterium]|nr:TatD family hydrolase [Candidatus Yonathbacteria bacterium]